MIYSNIKIKFISTNKEYINLVKKTIYEGLVTRIENYQPSKNTIVFYVSPANSLGFMDGGIDLPLSRKIMPGIESKLKQFIKKFGKENLINRRYLPIGSSIIVQHSHSKYLVYAPTMLLPQDVSKTHNSYWSSIAVLYNIIVNNKKLIQNKNVEIIFTSMCCGCGKMSAINSFNQTLQAINDFTNYKPTVINTNVIINEPNLEEQPNVYMNTEWKHINSNNIEKIR